MTVNPYSPPTGPIGSASDVAVPKSFARRLSLILAAVGFVGFWGGGLLFAVSARSGVTATMGLAFGIAILLAMLAHVVGVAVVFAAPRGRRLLPALLNGISLAIMVALTVRGYLGVPAA